MKLAITGNAFNNIAEIWSYGENIIAVHMNIGKVFKVTAADGREIGRFKLDYKPQIAQIKVFDGILYCPDTNHSLYAIKLQ